MICGPMDLGVRCVQALSPIGGTEPRNQSRQDSGDDISESVSCG